MIVSLTIVRYKRSAIPLALLAQAVLRIPLYMQKGCRFWKLMGSGRNGTFDLKPDLMQWAIFAVWDSEENLEYFKHGSLVAKWINTFAAECWTVTLSPITGHGFWDGQELFKEVKPQPAHAGPVAILTRATIRVSRLRAFWQNVPAVSKQMKDAKGLVVSFGIGEAPVYRQATFSVWDDIESMKEFAYRSREHADVIRSTRQQDWYSEELFARFNILASEGTINGINPLSKIEK